ncbi:MAG: cation diffusion facilitator family transporter [Cyanobacteria bacterium]|nr:cation diffusion facilitator family transporter [Cyanobacteriota bacterium]
MSHDCHHHHHPTDKEFSQGNRVKILKKVLILTFLYLIAEVVGGLLTGSLSLLADAGHMFADSGALALALFASWFAQYPSSNEKTYGYYRAEILAASLNGIVLAVVSLWIMYEAFQRWQNPPAVEGTGMLYVAIGGLVVNIIAVYYLHNDHQHNLNMKGAYLHVLGDLLGSVGAIVASILITTQGYYWADPLCSGLIALLVLFSAGKLMVETTNILLEGTPAHIDSKKVKEALLGIPGVVTVHDLHIWTITSGHDSLSAHLVVEPGAFSPETLQKAQCLLKDEFGVGHATLQLEPPDFEEEECHFESH